MSDSLTTTVVTTASYEIHFGRRILNKVADFILKNYSAQKVLLIVDQHVSKLHHSPIEDAFSSSFRNVFKYIIPRGEQSKSMEQYGGIVDLILKENIDRNTALVAIGGGVTGDLAGFVAASVLRGIPLIHVPTTLLSMVDSSIGGKTGVNHMPNLRAKVIKCIMSRLTRLSVLTQNARLSPTPILIIKTNGKKNSFESI